MRVALIGLDGLGEYTLRLLQKYIDVLPTIRKILNRGVRGKLLSLIPPVTGCVWLSMATGLNPGKTGVIDFLKRSKGFKAGLLSSEDFRGKSLWDFLSLEGFKVGVIDYPMLYPAYPINGFMVSSWGRELNTWPKSLLNEINDNSGGYDILIRYHDEKYDDIELFFHDLDEAVDRKLKGSSYLLRSKKWDLFIDIISFTDWMQHRLWHYIDPNHPLYQKDRFVKKKFIEYWQRIDEYLSRVLDKADYIFIVSDHGFGAQWGVFNIAKWLEEKKFLYRRRSLKNNLLKFLLNILKKNRWLIKFLPQKIYSKGQEIYSTTSSIIQNIDLDKSKVFIIGHTIPFGAIYINPKYNEEADKIVRRVKKELCKTGEKLGVRITSYRMEEIYNGVMIDRLPSLIFTVDNWSCVVIKDFSKNFIYRRDVYSPRHTGSHRLEGVLMIYGGEIKHKSMIEGSVLDIAPTILYLFDLPIPNNVDGKILKKIFREKGSLVKRKPLYVDPKYYLKKYMRIKLEKALRRLRG